MCQALCLLLFGCACVITGFVSSMWEAKNKQTQKLQRLSIASSSGLHKTQLNIQNLSNCRLSSAPNLAFVILVSLSLGLAPATSSGHRMPVSSAGSLCQITFSPDSTCTRTSPLTLLNSQVSQTLSFPLSATINIFTKLCQLSLNNFTLCFVWLFNLRGYKLPFDPLTGGPVLAHHQNNKDYASKKQL